MSLESLPLDILLDLPEYLHDLEDLYSLFLTSRTLFRACANPSPKAIPRLAANCGRVLFRPHPHLLIAATARQLADWAIKSNNSRYLLEIAVQGGVDNLLQLATDVAELSMEDIRRLVVYKNDVLNPLDRRLDLAAGPASVGFDGYTVCDDPETTLLSWAIYGELFHHNHDLQYLPFSPEVKPLSGLIRCKWFVHCMPNINSYHAFRFTDNEMAQYYADLYPEGNDSNKFYDQQRSMVHATEEYLNKDLWRMQFDGSPLFQANTDEGVRESFVSCAMHIGLRSLELLVPGGVEKLAGDLEDIMRGIHQRRLENELDENYDKRLRVAVRDRWLPSTHITLEMDLYFAMFRSWSYVPPDDEMFDSGIIAAVRDPPQKPGVDDG
ncbi:hypothetical protein R3P38DRAFT_7174 [Favolaschia claudopus]|uniref:F-box domain-containing protein n=1 Tax=Favolaschia claudopus TaxID=2862362 RepID=A0AAW0EFP0_9AGAR